MSAINFHTKEISVKIVYYGPGLCGKTTSLHTIYSSLDAAKRPQMVSLATEVDRTIFFDFLPVIAYRIKDFNVRLQLYTVPGQVFYNATRKLVLNGVDGIVFVCDSQRSMLEANRESLQNLAENLAELGLEPEQVPTVLQYNKRDLPDVVPVAELEAQFNPRHIHSFASVATTGTGVFEALKCISQLVVSDLMRKGLGRQLREQEASPGLKAPAAPDGFAAVGDAVPLPDEAQGAAGWWPAGVSRLHTEKLEAAIAAGRFAEVVVAVDAVLTSETQRADSPLAGGAAGAQLDARLRQRGASPKRVESYQRSLTAARGGAEVSRADAMSALLMVLEVLWPV